MLFEELPVGLGECVGFVDAEGCEDDAKAVYVATKHVGADGVVEHFAYAGSMVWVGRRASALEVARQPEHFDGQGIATDEVVCTQGDGFFACRRRVFQLLQRFSSFPHESFVARGFSEYVEVFLSYFCVSGLEAVVCHLPEAAEAVASGHQQAVFFGLVECFVVDAKVEVEESIKLRLDDTSLVGEEELLFFSYGIEREVVGKCAEGAFAEQRISQADGQPLLCIRAYFFLVEEFFPTSFVGQLDAFLYVFCVGNVAACGCMKLGAEAPVAFCEGDEGELLAVDERCDGEQEEWHDEADRLLPAVMLKGDDGFEQQHEEEQGCPHQEESEADGEDAARQFAAKTCVLLVDQQPDAEEEALEQEGKIEGAVAGQQYCWQQGDEPEPLMWCLSSDDAGSREACQREDCGMNRGGCEGRAVELYEPVGEPVCCCGQQGELQPPVVSRQHPEVVALHSDVGVGELLGCEDDEAQHQGQKECPDEPKSSYPRCQEACRSGGIA